MSDSSSLDEPKAAVSHHDDVQAEKREQYNQEALFKPKTTDSSSGDIENESYDPNEANMTGDGNVLGQYTVKQVMQMGRHFAEKHNLPNEGDIFARAAALARDPNKFDRMEFLTEDERIACYDEIKRPWTSMTRQLIAIICASAMSAAVQGMDETVINGALLDYPRALNLDGGSKRENWIKGLINGAPYLCCAGFSCWTTDWLNNRMGRKNVIFFTCLISAISCFLQGFGPSGTRGWHYLLSMRLLLGVGIGPKSATTNVYLAECASKEIRGCVTMMWQLNTALGIMFGYVFSLIFYRVPSHGISGGLNWRLILGSALIPAIFVMIQIPFCPESPRWLMGKDRYREAYESTVKIRPHKILACRDMFYQHILMMEEESLQLPFLVRLKEMVTVRRNRNGLIASCVCAFMQQFCGINVIAYYSSTIFTESGFAPLNALLASFGFGLINFVFAFPAFPMIDRFGRRYLLLRTFPWLSLFLLIAGFGFWIPKSSPDARLGVITMGIYVFTAIYSFSCGPVPFIIAAESANLASRSLNASIFTVVLWGFNFILSLTWDSMLAAMKAQGAFGFYAFWNLAGWFMVYFLLPETKQFTLEELDEVFDIPLRTRIAYEFKELWPNFQESILWRKNVKRQPPLGPHNRLSLKSEEWNDKASAEFVEKAN